MPEKWLQLTYLVTVVLNAFGFSPAGTPFTRGNERFRAWPLLCYAERTSIFESERFDKETIRVSET
jgi:hypothetical protein